MEKLYEYLPRELVTFVLVTLFSLLIGLSQRKISLKREGETTLFGTDRTFTFIGILGYLLYILDPVEYRLFMGWGSDIRSAARAELLRQAISIPCIRSYYHYYCTDHLLYCSHCGHATFLVLCDGGGDGIAFYRIEAYLYGTCAAYEE